MPKIKDIDKSKINFSKIATNSSDAVNGNYLNVYSIHQVYWGDVEELSFEEFDDGSVLIREGDTPIGWTNVEAIKDSINGDFGSSNSNNAGAINHNIIANEGMPGGPNYHSNSDVGSINNSVSSGSISDNTSGSGSQTSPYSK